MKVVITGAAGRLGTAIAPVLGEAHDLVLIDQRRSRGSSVHRADLRLRGLFPRRTDARWTARWERLFEGAHALIHLAAVPSPRASWRSVESHNIALSWHVFEAAARQGVNRIIFASSLFAVGDIETSLWDRYPPSGGERFNEDVELRPISPYGFSKATCEALGRMMVESGKVDAFLALRIGVFSKEPPHKPSMRPYWLSPGDTRTLFRRTLEAEVAGFHVAYGVSAQPSPCDASRTHRLLDWLPADSAPRMASP